MTTPNHTADHPGTAHHRGRIKLTHLDSTPAAHSPEQNGPTAWWADGTTSYVLHTRSGHVHGWTLADETDTVIQAVDSLRTGEEMAPAYLWRTLRDLRRLRTRLEALEGELLLYARESGPQGRPRMPLREIGEALDLHHTTVAERHARMTSGEVPEWRHWLTQGTPRATLYGGVDSRTAVPNLREQAETAPGGSFLAEAIPTDPGGYVITVTDYTVAPEQLARIDLPDWDHFRAASAGHRLIEHGYAVLPAAHMTKDRFAGWQAAPDGLTYSAPVYRLPQEGDDR